VTVHQCFVLHIAGDGVAVWPELNISQSEQGRIGEVSSWLFDHMLAIVIRSSCTFSEFLSMPSGFDRADVMGLGLHRI
jgi:hypothetical protein